MRIETEEVFSTSYVGLQKRIQAIRYIDRPVSYTHLDVYKRQPLEDWDTQRDQIVKALGDYGIAKIGCNHCTGRTAVEKMLASGLPVQRGTARNGSQTDLFLGNVDVLELGLEGASNP